MNTQFNKIVIVSLCDKFSKELGDKLSQELGMIFCDTKDLIEYELIDKHALELQASKEYLEQSEKNVIKHISSFENVVVAINYDYLRHNYDVLKNSSVVVFVSLPKKYVKENGNIIDVIEYNERSQALEKLSSLSIEVKNVDMACVCENIIKKLGGIL